MKTALNEAEISTIKEGIQRKYAQVARNGVQSCFAYPTGKEGLRQLGYPLELVQDVPEEVLAGFCGVGNPFSLGPIWAGEAVLDIGCGGGVDSLVAAKMVGPSGRVAGVDATAEMISRARSNLARLGLGNVRFEVAEASALPFPEGEFDVVLSNGVFNLTIDKERALREAHRVLKPGGRLMLADMVLVQELPPDLGDRVENWFQ
jgi:SAM-dependent methyltransferase